MRPTAGESFLVFLGVAAVVWFAVSYANLSREYGIKRKALACLEEHVYGTRTPPDINCDR